MSTALPTTKPAIADAILRYETEFGGLSSAPEYRRAWRNQLLRRPAADLAASLARYVAKFGALS